MFGRYRDLQVPATVHIELTNICNFRCRHCYNFWRSQEFPTFRMTRQQLDLILYKLIDNGVFHVIFTGGEPFLNYAQLLHGIRRTVEAGLSVSCNTNLLKAKKEQFKDLREAGLEHILTSLNTYDPETCDIIANVPDSLKKIKNGIRAAIEAGIRISVNMIISSINRDHIYKTAALAAELGAKTFCATRTIACVSSPEEIRKEVTVDRKLGMHILAELLRVEQDLGLKIGSLISFPHCMFKDIDKYRSLVGRGCPAGNLMMTINADGKVHACVQEERDYGNIFTDSLPDLWANMKLWRTGELLPKACLKCELLDLCDGGCRVAVKDQHLLKGRDNLMSGPGKINKPYRKLPDEESLAKVEKTAFRVPETLRFRKENGFYLVNVSAANNLFVDNEDAELLIRYQKSKGSFRLGDFGKEKKRELARLMLAGSVSPVEDD